MSYIERQIKAAFDELREEDAAMRAACVKLKPFMGDIDPADFKDADELYEAVFKSLGVDVSGVDPSAYGPMISMLKSSQVKTMMAGASDRRIAADSAIGKASDGFYDRWPQARPQRFAK